MIALTVITLSGFHCIKKDDADIRPGPNIERNAT
jgi:hypothetical protein